MGKQIKHKIIDGIKHKRCSKCEEWKLLESFGKCSDKWDKLKPQCKKCRAASGKKYREDNRSKSMKSILLSLITITLVSCGHNFTNGISSDPTFDVFKLNWKHDTGRDVEYVDIIFAEFDDNADAKCTWYISHPSQNYIQVDIDFWYRASDELREQVIYHELAHCDLHNFEGDDGKGHRTARLFNCPMSVLNKYTFSENEITNCYIPHRDYYIQELLDNINF